MAAQKKEERIRQAELEKQEARENNATTRKAVEMVVTPPRAAVIPRQVGHTYSTTGQTGLPTGAIRCQLCLDMALGSPLLRWMRAGLRPTLLGSHTGVGGSVTHNTRVQGYPHGYGTGRTYS
ncbi:Seed maturation protein [Corchorus olitorius]|uniref:Seed maturation protein n=1 Tax=Corchorus olitorius TaxID=93759 RepID=A0A1R3GPE1_9ROSI|nr:Seed maturation protein [Corchorus olitorius]